MQHRYKFHYTAHKGNEGEWGQKRKIFLPLESSQLKLEHKYNTLGTLVKASFQFNYKLALADLSPSVKTMC